jgi:hypothetical protein
MTNNTIEHAAENLAPLAVLLPLVDILSMDGLSGDARAALYDLLDTRGHAAETALVGIGVDPEIAHSAASMSGYSTSAEAKNAIDAAWAALSRVPRE